MTIELEVDGVTVEVADDRSSLMSVLRDQCGKISVKDGCAPQGQCGCCTVLVDGKPRVSCVTPVRRVAGRAIVTLEGLDAAEQQGWADAFVATGGSQCGFCTPGIICRLSAARRDGVGVGDQAFGNALAAHLCRCTGWQTISEAYVAFGSHRAVEVDAAEARAEIEGGVGQRVGADVALGRAGFSVDTVPKGASFAVPDGDGWAVAESIEAAREASGKIQGRRTTASSEPPIAVPDGDWALTLQTSWVEPASLETETTWCEPGDEPSSLLANGGAFGAKAGDELGGVARRLADEHGRPVAVVLSREDSVRLGAKRPPIAAGVRSDGTGVIRVARTADIADAIARVAPDLEIEQVDVAGPSTSAAIRGAGWVEAAVLVAAATDAPAIIAPSGATATATIDDSGAIVVEVDAGRPLDEVVLRSYCIGAAHMAHSWVTSEQLTVDADGTIHDLTIRSFGIVRAADTPPIDVRIAPSDRSPVNGSDAVFAAVALATWRARGLPGVWPTG